MFWLSFAFLGLMACNMVLWIDVPRVLETTLAAADPDASLTKNSLADAVRNQVTDQYTLNAIAWGNVVFRLLMLLWPVFIAEQLLYFFLSGQARVFQQQHPYWWAFCLFPALRMCARHRGSRQRIWLPWMGWQTADRHLLRRLEHIFSVPMIGIALLILPVLGLQTYYQDRIVDLPILHSALHIGTGVIWFAFALEFIVMVSVTPRKLAYCRKHWLDLLIILLPLISFLRTLRILRAAKLMNVAKLQQLSRLMRVYRLRGVALRGWRALILLELVQRLLFISPEKRLRKLEEQFIDKQHELEHLRQQIESLRARLPEPSASVTSEGDIRQPDLNGQETVA